MSYSQLTQTQGCQIYTLKETDCNQTKIAEIVVVDKSTISEHCARLQTMDSAISNLDERIAGLEIQYHSICQERITQGVLEVQGNMRRRKKRSGG